MTPRDCAATGQIGCEAALLCEIDNVILYICSPGCDLDYGEKQELQELRRYALHTHLDSPSATEPG